MLVYISRLAHSPPFNPALGLRSAERGDLGVLRTATHLGFLPHERRDTMLVLYMLCYGTVCTSVCHKSELY